MRLTLAIVALICMAGGVSASSIHDGDMRQFPGDQGSRSGSSDASGDRFHGRLMNLHWIERHDHRHHSYVSP